MSTDYSLKTFARGAVYISANHPFDVHSITKAIGIEPTYVWYPKKERQPPFSQMCWGFELPPQDYGTIDIPVNEILDIFLPLRDRIIPFVRH